MGVMSRIKSTAGGNRNSIALHIPGAAGSTLAELPLPDDSNIFAVYTSGENDVTVSKIRASETTRNRKVTLYCEPEPSTTGYVTFTNTSNAAVPGEMDLGGSDVTLDPSDVLVLLLRADGTWLRLRNTDN